MTNQTDTQARSIQVTHFNWEGESTASSFPATAQVVGGNVILEIQLTKENRKKFTLTITKEALASGIAQRIESGQLQLVSVFFAETTFAGTDIDDTDGMEIVAVAGESNDELRMAIFAASEEGQSVIIDAGDKFGLRISQHEGELKAYRQECFEAGYDLELIDLTAPDEKPASDIEVAIGEEAIVLFVEDRYIELLPCLGLKEINAILFDNDLEVVALFCINRLLLNDRQLEELGQFKVLAHDEDKHFLLIGGARGSKGMLFDLDGFEYFFSCGESGFALQQENSAYTFSFEEGFNRVEEDNDEDGEEDF